MFEKAIQKLKNEKSKLTGEAKKFDTKYKNKIRRIDTAVQKLKERIEASSSQPKANSASAEIEIILREAAKAMSVTEITDTLHRRGFVINRQSVSSHLQTYAKQKKKYRRVAPATFTLLAKLAKGKRTAAAGGSAATITT